MEMNALQNAPKCVKQLKNIFKLKLQPINFWVRKFSILEQQK